MKMRNLIFAIGIIASMNLFADWYDRCPPQVFAKIKDSIVIITGDNGSGTGFIIEMDGAKWMMTNEHVVRGQGKIHACTLSGIKIIPTNTVDLAVNRDLIRYKLDDEFKALKIRSSMPAMNEEIWVFGNSDGSGVITSIGGEVLGLGEDKVEVSAKFVAGNSGSPVVDKKGDVIGVATFAEIKRESYNWVKAGTRFNDTRRFAETLGGVVWEPLGYEQYLEDCATICRCLDQCIGFATMVDSGGFALGGKPNFRRAKDVRNTSVSVICKDKKSRKVYDAIKAADAAYEKTVKAYENTKSQMGYSSRGKIGSPSEITLRRRQKDVDNAYQAMLKRRKEGLARAKTLIEECNVKSERAKGEVKKVSGYIDELISEFNNTCKKYGVK